MSFKKAKLEEVDKKVVTFYKDESKEVLKHTVNYFKKTMFRSEHFIILLQSILNIIHQVICQKMAVHKEFLINSFKHWSSWWITRWVWVNAALVVDLTLVNQQLVVIWRNEHRSEFIKEDQYGNIRNRINNKEQNPTV